MSVEVSITKRFGKSFRLDVDFRTDGECLGILGASGCGKSITLKCIAGIEKPDKGRIIVNDRVLFDSDKRINVRPQDRHVGYLFQNYALFPRMTIEQNIGIGVRDSAEKKERLVHEMLERFHLEGMEKRFPDQLSGGQQQRVALARMIAAGPDILLLDEPFSALDTYLREQMQLQLLSILKNYRDVIMVTHSRDEAYKLCNALMVLDNGKILGHGETKDVFADPQNVKIARLTGCKNISRIEKIDARRFTAVEWGLELDAEKPIPENATYVGFRAHDFTPVYKPEPGMNNLVKMHVVDRNEDVFEWNIIFYNANIDRPPEEGEIWWKYSKYALHDVPTYLRFPPEALLYLHDDYGDI